MNFPTWIRWRIVTVIGLGIALFLAVYIIQQPAPISPEVAQCLEGAGGAQYESPDGKNYATDLAVVSADQRKCVTIPVMEIVQTFVGWTRDSRYAVFNLGNQYGDLYGTAFDAVNWERIPLHTLAAPAPGTLPTGSNHFGVVGIAPQSNRVVPQDGSLINLPNTVQTNVLRGMQNDRVAAVAWSPDEAQFAFVGWDVTDVQDTSIDPDLDIFLYQGIGYDNLRESRQINLPTYELPSLIWLGSESVFQIIVAGVAETIQ